MGLHLIKLILIWVDLVLTWLDLTWLTDFIGLKYWWNVWIWPTLRWHANVVLSIVVLSIQLNTIQSNAMYNIIFSTSWIKLNQTEIKSKSKQVTIFRLKSTIKSVNVLTSIQSFIHSIHTITTYYIVFGCV